jgi:hypothetical protein
VTALKISRTLSLPLDVVTEAVGMIATRGAGKSYGSVALIEEAFDALVQTVVIDPTGVYHGLRSSADGKRDGLPIYVFGGAHGDLPLEDGSGSFLADLVVDSGHSFVFDLSDFSKTKARTWVAAFLERLYERKARERTTLLLVVDEADEFAPQKARGESARVLGAMEQIVKRGRSRGIGCVLISQRTQAINKDVLDLIDTLIVMRIGSPRGRDAVADWISAKEERDELGVLEGLASLPTGTAYVWSPVRGMLEKFTFRRIKTFDSYATPKPGEVRIEPSKRAALDLSALGEQMSATVERAKENDPAELRKRLHAAERAAQSEKDMQGILDEIERVLSSSGGETAAEWLVQIYMGVSNALNRGFSCEVVDEVRALVEPGSELVEISVLTDEDRALLREGWTTIEAAQPLIDSLRLVVERAVASSPAVPPRLQGDDPATARAGRGTAAVEAKTEGAGSAADRRSSAAATASTADRTARSGPEAVVESHASGGGSSNGVLTSSQQKILDAMAWYERLGVTTPTRAQIAMIAGYSHTSGGYNNIHMALKAEGYVTYERGSKAVAMTPEGRALATDPGLPTTNEGVQEAILRRLPVPQAKLLAEIIRAYPNSITREELAERTGYTASSGGYNNLLSKLRTGALIEYGADRTVFALDVLFPMG